MPEIKEKKPRKPRAVKEPKAKGPLVLSFKTAFTPEQKSEMMQTAEEMAERLAREKKDLQALKAAIKKRATVERVQVFPRFDDSGCLRIYTDASNSAEISLAELSPAQLALCCRDAREVRK